jgi:hypothetical protein
MTIMEMNSRCPECGAAWEDNQTCQEHFYAHPIQWPITVVNVTAAGVDLSIKNVKAWARSVYEALKASGNDT